MDSNKRRLAAAKATRARPCMFRSAEEARLVERHEGHIGNRVSPSRRPLWLGRWVPISEEGWVLVDGITCEGGARRYSGSLTSSERGRTTSSASTTSFLSGNRLASRWYP